MIAFPQPSLPGIARPNSSFAFLALASLTLFAARAESETCPPIATVEGDPAAVASIEAALRAEAIETSGMGACPAVRVRADRRGETLTVTIEDVDGRSSARDVATPEAAAAIIESWTRRDMSLSLLDVQAVPTPPPTPAAPVTGAPPAPATGTAPSPFRLGATIEVSGGFDGSTWFGGRLGGCVRLGPTCTGLLARAAYDPGFTGAAEQLGGTRVAVDGLAFVDLPIAWAKVSLVPGIGVGGGWIRSRGYVGGADEHGENAGDNEDDSGAVAALEDAGGVRLDAHVALLVLVGRGFALELGLDAGVSVPAHTDPYAGEGRRVAGEPRGFVRGGLGLVYGAP